MHLNNQPHQQDFGAAMAEGLKRHGVEVRHGGLNEPEPCDFAVVWGYKQHRVINAAPHVLVMERGHFGDRMAMTSCGWDGLGYRGHYPKAPNGERWLAAGYGAQPWSDRATYMHALIIGQVEYDAALRGLNIVRWAEDVERELMAYGWKSIRFRPHPLADRARPTPWLTLTPKGSTLAEDLADADLCVTFNSTAGVEAVLAGVPTVTIDQGAMAWPVAAHSLMEGLKRPDRTEWAWDLAWTQWSRDEIASGETWAHLALVMDA